MLEHTLKGHPEHAGRLQAVWGQLEAAGLVARMRAIEPEPASIASLEAVHTPAYVRFLQEVAAQADRVVGLDADTYFCPTSFEIARLAAGGMVSAVDAVLRREVDNALVVARPPGHHAMPDHAMGFCLLGNAAIGAQHARQAHRLDRVLIVDYDVHHGNGTEAMFYNDAAVMFISTHQYPFYPGTGALDDIGQGPGRGATINIPLPGGHGDASYLALYQDIMWPLVRRFKPQFIVVSAGFDAHWGDPLASMELSLTCYAQLTRELIAMAAEVCDGRIVFLMEGGYDLDVLGQGVVNIAHALLGDTTIRDTLGAAPKARTDIGPLIDQIRAVHRLND